MIHQQLTDQQKEGRAINASAELLQRRLIVPKIYFEALWPNRQARVDLLAIDRAGSGDVHIVEAVVGVAAANYKIQQLLHIPSHYKYLAIYEPGNYVITEDLVYASDGFGRVGIIYVTDSHQGEAKATIGINPERFRVAADVFKDVDRFTSKTRPDIEVRP